MSGLEKMKSRILEEAEQSAQEILAKAQADAEAAVTAAEGRARAAGEPPKRSSIARNLLGNTVPESSWLRFICVALVIGMMPGSTGTVMPASLIL